MMLICKTVLLDPWCFFSIAPHEGVSVVIPLCCHFLSKAFESFEYWSLCSLQISSRVVFSIQIFESLRLGWTEERLGLQPTVRVSPPFLVVLVSLFIIVESPLLHSVFRMHLCGPLLLPPSSSRRISMLGCGWRCGTVCTYVTSIRRYV